jgi:putative ABC transport system permease protein
VLFNKESEMFDLIGQLAMVTAVLTPVFERGFLFSIVVASLYITSRVLNRDDLTTEGSFGLSGAVTAFFVSLDYSIVSATVAGMFAGMCAGMLTGVIHTKIKVNHVIAGLIVTSALFSIQLKIAGAHRVINALSYNSMGLNIVLLFAGASLLTYGFLSWFLQTEIGLIMRAVGTNPSLVTSLGKSPDAYVILGFMVANLFTGLSGALFVQYTGFFSIWAGFGVLVIGLAGLILGELYDSRYGLQYIASACLYQIIIFITYELNIDPDLNRAVTALFILILLPVHNKIRR